MKYNLVCSRGREHLWISERESFKHLVFNGSYNIMVHWRQSAWLLGELGIKVAHRLLSFLLTEKTNTSLNTRHLSQQCPLHCIIVVGQGAVSL